jgi:hypothetical protein
MSLRASYQSFQGLLARGQLFRRLIGVLEPSGEAGGALAFLGYPFGVFLGIPENPHE